jgi:hypothetical protein
VVAGSAEGAGCGWFARRSTVLEALGAALGVVMLWDDRAFFRDCDTY